MADFWKTSMMAAVLFGGASGGETGPALTPEAVRTLTRKVADWQIATFEDMGDYRALPSMTRRQSWHNTARYPDLVWHCGALYAGMDQWRRIADDPSPYTDFLMEIGERNDWEFRDRPYHADDHAVGQFYLSFYEEFQDADMLEPTQEHFDWILKHPKTGTLEWNADSTDAHNRWGWCDALFMAPPVWTRLAKVTGDRKYLDFMDQEYRATYDLLWDKEDHLFWRDSSYFKRRESNGRNLFWARGNGWVFGGLALMIPDLPADWAHRDFYLNLFKDMAESLKNCQRPDGTWSMGLLGGVEAYPIKETSGTGFFTFGLAWGINSGVLDRAEYEPVVLKAWRALADCVTDEGLLGYVQPVSAAPGDAFADKTELYGVGAFLAAGAEVYKMVGGKAPPARLKFETFVKDGGWARLRDPQAIIKNGKLIIGGIGSHSGDVKVSIYDLKAGKHVGTAVLQKTRGKFVFDAPVLRVRPDGSLLAIYARHAPQTVNSYRISDPVDYLQWGAPKRYTHAHAETQGMTYINLIAMKDEGLLYNFFRDEQDYDPCFISSSDQGKTWENLTRFIAHDKGGAERPYARYLQRDDNTVGIVFTDVHPRQSGNHLYYADFRNRAFYNVDGTKIKELSAGPLHISEAESIQPVGDVSHRVWSCALAMDPARNPHVGYSVSHTNEARRFCIAAWNGERWTNREIAYAGAGLFSAEGSNAGMITFDPEDPSHVYIATDVDPSTGKSLGGTHEIYMATIEAGDDSSPIEWTPITYGSQNAHIRPMVVVGEGYKVVIWLNGHMENSDNYESDIIGVVQERP